MLITHIAQAHSKKKLKTLKVHFYEFYVLIGFVNNNFICTLKWIAILHDVSDFFCIVSAVFQASKVGLHSLKHFGNT